MKSSEKIAYSAHASYCVSQASLAKDDRLKAYWDDLADSWNALDESSSELSKDINARVLQPR